MLFPECLEDWIDEDNPVRVIDVFVDGLVLADLGFVGVDPEATGRPSYHPSVLLKPYIYGYLNRNPTRTSPLRLGRGRLTCAKGLILGPMLRTVFGSQLLRSVSIFHSWLFGAGIILRGPFHHEIDAFDCSRGCPDDCAIDQHT